MRDEVLTKRKLRERHGYAGSSLYRVWKTMVSRCHSPTCRDYKNYGARGIAVCSEWRDSVGAFIEHVSKLPHYGEEGYSVDRIDNDGNYEPGNVRWATQSEQNRNQRRNHLLTHDGKTQCITAWANDLGIKPATIISRLERGWSVAEAVTATKTQSRRQVQTILSII